MNYKIRSATEEDFESMLEMVQELAEFEEEPNAVANSLSQMKQEQEYFEAFVVEVENEIVAMAIYFFAYYTWVGKSLYLDDLYVKEDFRSMGIGSALLREVRKVAQEKNCKRVRWQVLNWNKPAIGAYEKIGANIDNNWSNCDIDHEQIKNFKI